MKRIILLLVFCGFLIGGAASCNNVNTSPIWWNSWLVEPVCKLPCWQNITPGVTTMKEAISILETSPDIKISFRSKDGVDWNFTQDKNEGGYLRVSQDGIVRSITLGGDLEKELLLQTITASYGNPKYVKAYDCRDGMCSTFLIYPDLGMLVGVFVKNTSGNNENPQIEILPEIVSNRVLFIKSGVVTSQIQVDFPDYGLPMGWKGYGEYP